MTRASISATVSLEAIIKLNNDLKCIDCNKSEYINRAILAYKPDSDSIFSDPNSHAIGNQQ